MSGRVMTKSLKVSYFTQAYVSKNYRIIRFLNQEKDLEMTKSVLKLGSQIKLVVPEIISNEFTSKFIQEPNISLLNDKKMNFENIIQGDRTLYLSPITTFRDPEFVDVIYKEENPEYYKMGNDIFKYFDFTGVSQGQTFEITADNNCIELNDNFEFIIRDYVSKDDRQSNLQESTAYSNKQNKVIKNVKKIGMICEGFGISPMFQIINYLHLTNNFKDKITNFFKEKPAISLLYKSNFSEEICFAEDLFKYSYDGNIFYYPILKYPKPEFKFGSGCINDSNCKDYLPDSKDSNAIVIVSGSDDFYNKEVDPLLQSNGFIEGENLFYFNHKI